MAPQDDGLAGSRTTAERWPRRSVRPRRPARSGSAARLAGACRGPPPTAESAAARTTKVRWTMPYPRISLKWRKYPVICPKGRCHDLVLLKDLDFVLVLEPHDGLEERHETRAHPFLLPRTKPRWARVYGQFRGVRSLRQPQSTHYPTGASKWNPIEHRLFSALSLNWAGEPLDSYQKVLNYARTTTTQTELTVTAYFNPPLPHRAQALGRRDRLAMPPTPRGFCASPKSVFGYPHQHLLRAIPAMLASETVQFPLHSGYAPDRATSRNWSTILENKAQRPFVSRSMRPRAVG